MNNLPDEDMERIIYHAGREACLKINSRFRSIALTCKFNNYKLIDLSTITIEDLKPLRKTIKYIKVISTKDRKKSQIIEIINYLFDSFELKGIHVETSLCFKSKDEIRHLKKIISKNTPFLSRNSISHTLFVGIGKQSYEYNNSYISIMNRVLGSSDSDIEKTRHSPLDNLIIDLNYGCEFLDYDDISVKKYLGDINYILKIHLNLLSLNNFVFIPFSKPTNIIVFKKNYCACINFNYIVDNSIIITYSHYLKVYFNKLKSFNDALIKVFDTDNLYLILKDTNIKSTQYKKS